MDLKTRCQMFSLPQMAISLGKFDILCQKRHRLKRICKRRWNYLINFIARLANGKMKLSNKQMHESRNTKLHAGDLVRVRSKEEIVSTLNSWDQLKRCAFMEEMWPYCGTKQRVLKRVEKFLDERDYLIKKCNGIVILENLLCEGTKDFGPCDRACFYFWREEWLEKLE